jgi:hypothetical protein
MKLTLSLVMVVLIGLFVTPAWAQDEVNEGSAGLLQQIKWVAPQEFQRVEEEDSSEDWNYHSDLELYDDGDDSDARWRAAIHLPDGAKIATAKWYVYDECGDTPSSEPIKVQIRKVRPRPAAATTDEEVCSAESATGLGYTLLNCDFVQPANRTFRNNNHYYLATIWFQSYGCWDRRHRFSGLKIAYNLQVSPAPAGHTFVDVLPGHKFFQFVEALADSGITDGCAPHKFCPDDPLTRGQMAKFLAKALGLYWAP